MFLPYFIIHSVQTEKLKIKVCHSEEKKKFLVIFQK